MAQETEFSIVLNLMNLNVKSPHMPVTAVRDSTDRKLQQEQGPLHVGLLAASRD